MPYDFCTLDGVKTYKGISGTGLDYLIGQLIPRATAEICAYLNRTVCQATFTELKDGDGGASILVRERPIVSVTTLHDSYDGTFNSSTLVAAADYAVDKTAGIVRFRYGRGFICGSQNVQVVYVGGYVQVPPVIEQVAIELVTMKIEARDSLVSSSISHGDGSRAVIKAPALTAEHKRTLEPYRNKVAA